MYVQVLSNEELKQNFRREWLKYIALFNQHILIKVERKILQDNKQTG